MNKKDLTNLSKDTHKLLAFLAEQVNKLTKKYGMRYQQIILNNLIKSMIDALSPTDAIMQCEVIKFELLQDASRKEAIIKERIRKGQIKDYDEIPGTGKQ